MTMTQLRYRLTFLTPAFLGNADQAGEWSVSSVRFGRRILSMVRDIAWSNNGVPKSPQPSVLLSSGLELASLPMVVAN